ncbi:MAG: DUF3892 domain-containing protein [Colwellia sp.]|nr:DUF3892 domain-containing protein [Colwellia sp.]
MTGKRKIVAAKADSNGNISAVKLDGNSNFTSIDTAKRMTQNGQIDAVYVEATRNTVDHIRQRPNNIECDNLDDMVGQ